MLPVASCISNAGPRLDWTCTAPTLSDDSIGNIQESNHAAVFIFDATNKPLSWDVDHCWRTNGDGFDIVFGGYHEG